MPIKTQMPLRKRPTEKEIQARIMQALQMEGWLVIRLNSGAFKGTKGNYIRTYIIQGLNASAGLPDVIAFKGARFLLIEVKDHKGQLTDAQIRFHQFAERFGVEVNVLRHWDEVEELID